MELVVILDLSGTLASIKVTTVLVHKGRGYMVSVLQFQYTAGVDLCQLPQVSISLLQAEWDPGKC